MNWIYFLIAVYIIGAIVAFKMMKEWSNTWYEKIAFSVIWPMTAILYVIYWLHKKM